MYCPLIHPHIDYLENYLKSNLCNKKFAHFISFIALMCNNFSIVLSAGIKFHFLRHLCKLVPLCRFLTIFHT